MRGSAAGFTEWLLFHLWKQNEETGLSCPYVLVPDTIIYRWGRPFFWYFTTHTGELLRKSKNRVSHKFISQEFLNSTNPSGLVSSYLSFQDENKGEGSSKAISHFFTKDSFCTRYSADFITNREKSLSGLLQKWVEPKGTRNCKFSSAMIKVVWSPLFSVMERRVNGHSLNDQKVDFYDRLVTYEGMESNSTPESLTVPQLVADIQKICMAMVDHIRTVSGGNVSVTRLILYFKQDQSDRLWLLFCGGVQIYDMESEKSKGPEAELELCIPELAKSKVLVRGKNYFELQANRVPCLGCNLLIKQDEMYPISFDLLVTCYENGLDQPPNKTNVENEATAAIDLSQEQASDDVPQIIKRAVAGITNERYRALRNNVKWLNTNTTICESCYLYYTGFVLYGKTKEPVKETVVVIKPLEPEMTIEEIMKDRNPKKVVNSLSSVTKSRLVSPASVLSTPKTRELRSVISVRTILKSQPKKPKEIIHKLEGRFTIKRLPALMNIYTGLPADLSRSTRSSSHSSSTRQIRFSEMSPDKQTSMLLETIKSLKTCLISGV